jgi:hypothetical protein
MSIYESIFDADGLLPTSEDAALPKRKSQLPSIETLKEYLNYDPNTGVITWKKTSSFRRKAGLVAGCLKKNGYRHLQLNGALMLAHRVAFAMTHGRWPRPHCDHINGDVRDNRACNLRECTHAQNTRNVRMSSRNRVGAKGVSWCPRRRHYYARVCFNGKQRYLGCFKKLRDAVKAARAVRKQLHGEFARH